jgi:hypothetical protein
VKPFARLATAAIAAALLSACAPARYAVKPEFWQAKQASIGVALAPHPTGGAHKVGAQGLLDLAINHAMAAELQTHLSKFDLSGFEDVRDGFVQELAKRGMTVKALPGSVNPEEFPKWGGEPAMDGFIQDLGALRQKHGIDVLVLLSVRRFGTIRSYFGFIPTSEPKALFEVQGQMIDLKTNRLIWQTVIQEDEAAVPSPVPWDQPPDYPNLTGALRKAIENGKSFLLREFFVASA